ncbi:imidazoleglycerol-phosphate dehydratase HisB [Ruminococcaceae bacterium OttesenSCG-928-O06]|nr:imidazoleglycerol-phosphate dehydratase HisB [Ruminococcaceae bacterium OttesenSCG-928-O06]
MRTANIERKTSETNITCTLRLEGTGKAEIATGVGFLDHMLQLFCKHGRFDVSLTCQGDVQVDDHHSVEDVGIVLGRATAAALGDCAGIFRYGSMLLPMDEALVLASLDVSGRGGLYFEVDLPTEKIGTFDTELVKEFFAAYAREAGMTLHVRQLAGGNSHHIAEAAFKGFARALATAVKIDPRADGQIPSSKGTLV